ncbi:MAG: glycosyltransferase [Rikenellaceae bacterium]
MEVLCQRYFCYFVDKAFSFISQSDIGIIPSVVRESFCLSIVEFMELGNVVVSTNNGAQPEFIDDRYTL